MDKNKCPLCNNKKNESSKICKACRSKQKHIFLTAKINYCKICLEWNVVNHQNICEDCFKKKHNLSNFNLNLSHIRKLSFKTK